MKKNSWIMDDYRIDYNRDWNFIKLIKFNETGAIKKMIKLLVKKRNKLNINISWEMKIIKKVFYPEKEKIKKSIILNYWLKIEKNN